MAPIIIIPIVVVAIIGLSSYLIYQFVLYDWSCKRRVNRMLKKYDIRKTPSQIIREYHQIKGETISSKKIRDLERSYRQKDPDRFLAMFDVIRDNPRRDGA